MCLGTERRRRQVFSKGFWFDGDITEEVGARIYLRFFMFCLRPDDFQETIGETQSSLQTSGEFLFWIGYLNV